MSVFDGEVIADRVVAGTHDGQRLAGQRRRRDVARLLQPMFRSRQMVAVKNSGVIAGNVVPRRTADCFANVERLLKRVPHEGWRQSEFDTFQLAVSRRHGHPEAVLHLAPAGVNTGVRSQHDRRNELRQPREQQRPFVLLLGMVGKQAVQTSASKRCASVICVITATGRSVANR